MKSKKISTLFFLVLFFSFKANGFYNLDDNNTRKKITSAFKKYDSVIVFNSIYDDKGQDFKYNGIGYKNGISYFFSGYFVRNKTNSDIKRVVVENKYKIDLALYYNKDTVLSFKKISQLDKGKLNDNTDPVTKITVSFSHNNGYNVFIAFLKDGNFYIKTTFSPEDRQESFPNDDREYFLKIVYAQEKVCQCKMTSNRF